LPNHATDFARTLLQWAEEYYVKNGQQTETFDHYRRAVAQWVKHYGDESVDAFTPLSLVFLQKQWVEKGYARLTVNFYVSIIKQAVKHGVKFGWAEANTHYALQAVDNLKAGRTKAPEYRKVKPVDAEIVEKTLPFLPSIVADMVRVQRFSGMRPQDVRNMRSCDIEQTGDVWKYTPFTHKTEHQGKKRAVPVGPRAQAILMSYLLRRLRLIDWRHGSGGRTFKSSVKEVISNDLEYYAYVINRHYIGNNEIIQDGQYFIDTLNRLPLEHKGFIYTNYCPGGGSGRMYFSDKNGKKIDTMRKWIEWLKIIGIDDDLYYFLLASLIESSDAVSNTTALYTAYLKNLIPSAQKSLILEPAHFETTKNAHRVYNENANDLIRKISGDILYLDPPYTGRQYGGDYHLLNTIGRYDNFVPAGKTGRREYQRSTWASSKSAAGQLDDLLKHVKFKFTFMSYNNEGILSSSTIERIMKQYCSYDVATTEYKRFKSSAGTHKAKTTTEHVHILEKP
jgi:adenine-specific DNA-methyltransferase